MSNKHDTNMRLSKEEVTVAMALNAWNIECLLTKEGYTDNNIREATFSYLRNATFVYLIFFKDDGADVDSGHVYVYYNDEGKLRVEF